MRRCFPLNYLCTLPTSYSPSPSPTNKKLVKLPAQSCTPWNEKFSNVQTGKMGGDTMNFFLASPRTRQGDFLKGMRKNVYFQFLWFANTFSSNLNIMNLKFFSNHGEIYMFNRKFNNSIGGLGKFQVKSVSFFVFLFCFFS